MHIGDAIVRLVEVLHAARRMIAAAGAIPIRKDSTTHFQEMLCRTLHSLE